MTGLIKYNVLKSLVLVSISILLFSFFGVKQKHPGSKLYFLQVNARELIPEGIAVHPSTGSVYLSSLHQNKIVKVDTTGNLTDVITNSQEGFMWGLGMKFSKDGKLLWACSADGKGNTALFAIDHVSGKVMKRYTHDSARFFNDLVILNGGEIFITDTETGALFQLQNGKLRLFIKDEKLTWANGITATPAGDILFVASGRYGLMKVDPVNRMIASATDNKTTDYAIDGLVLQDTTLFAAIGWPQDSIHQHRLIRYTLDKNFNYTGKDTLSMNQSWLECPTTLALYKNQLYCLSTTNLGIYNRHKQKTREILDSLKQPVIAIYKL